MPFFIRRLFSQLLDPHQTLPISWMMLMVVLSAIYVLSPVDFLPESVLGIVGFLDDLLILLIVFMHLAAVYQSLLVYRHSGQYAEVGAHLEDGQVDDDMNSGQVD